MLVVSKSEFKLKTLVQQDAGVLATVPAHLIAVDVGIEELHHV